MDSRDLDVDILEAIICSPEPTERHSKVIRCTWLSILILLHLPSQTKLGSLGCELREGVHERISVPR